MHDIRCGLCCFVGKKRADRPGKVTLAGGDPASSDATCQHFQVRIVLPKHPKANRQLRMVVLAAIRGFLRFDAIVIRTEFTKFLGIFLGHQRRISFMDVHEGDQILLYGYVSVLKGDGGVRGFLTP